MTSTHDVAGPDESSPVLEVPIRAGLAILAGAALAWLEPFSTSQADQFARFGYWTALSAAWLALVGLLEAWMRRGGGGHVLGRRPRVSSALLASLPMTVVAEVATSALIGWRPTVSDLLELYGQVLLVGAGLSFAAFSVLQRFNGATQTARAERGAQAGSRAAGLPAAASLAPGLTGDVYCLQMEDHYVRIHLAAGSQLTLMRMSDAVAALGSASGQRVHRSWWVAREAVDELVKQGRRTRLLLTNGVSVPVSQPYVAEVEALFG